VKKVYALLLALVLLLAAAGEVMALAQNGQAGALPRTGRAADAGLNETPQSLLTGAQERPGADAGRSAVPYSGAAGTQECTGADARERTGTDAELSAVHRPLLTCARERTGTDAETVEQAGASQAETLRQVLTELAVVLLLVQAAAGRGGFRHFRRRKAVRHRETVQSTRRGRCPPVRSGVGVA